MKVWYVARYDLVFAQTQEADVGLKDVNFDKSPCQN